MKLYHVATDKPVELGDKVRRVDGLIGVVRGWQYPQGDDTGHVIIKLGPMDTSINVEPSMLNLEWREEPVTQTVSFDRTTREALRTEYETAVKLGLDAFSFGGQMYLTVYADYLLQYLDARLGK